MEEGLSFSLQQLGLSKMKIKRCANCGYDLDNADWDVICDHGDFCSKSCWSKFHSDLEVLDALEGRRK
jgi:hypothetical protein